ncbi:hypothetical protein LSH36_266g01010 [Paralvinella palmiformis]|uniref:Uncharacterized protein n=1 Tax=Paralvinella palmiformis TaxID=53620 RepID=A0AAD9N3X5_9ANNE|nr:hypothetical protein LSH36_266g01010 [Paralvinella palmiformis]
MYISFLPGDSAITSADQGGDRSEAAANPSVSSHTEHGTSAPCVTSSLDVTTSVVTSSSLCAHSTVVTPIDPSCSTSSSSSSHSPILESVTVASPSTSSSSELTTTTIASEQGMTQTNTFGASMVTTIVTSTVSMGSVLSTSFSLAPSSGAVACVPTTLPTVMCSAQVTKVGPPMTVSASPLPMMVSCQQDLKANAVALHTEAPVAMQSAEPHSAPVTLLGPLPSGVGHQAIRAKQADRSSLQALPRIVPMNNGVHVDQLPQNMSPVSVHLGGHTSITHTVVGDQYESLKPHTVTYAVHPCATIHEDHTGSGQLHANLIHVPLVQSMGNCVSANAEHSLDNQPTKLVMTSLQHVAHVATQRSFDEKNDLQQEDSIITTKIADVCHNAVTRSIGCGEPHAVIGAQSGLLQLDSAQCPVKCTDACVDNRCSKDRHLGDQDRADCKPSRGISIMKPLYDRESEIEEELHLVAPDSADGSAAQKVAKTDAPIVEEVHANQLHSNQLSNIVLPKGKSPFTIAQILEEADKQRRNQAQLKQKALLATQTDCIKPEIPILNDSLNISQLGNKTVFQVSGMVTPVKSTKTGFSLCTTPVPVKSLVPSLDFSKNASSHLANFVQKSLQTPVLFNSAPHPITSPGFPLNLTESVKKVMNAIPRTDTTPPPSPIYNKGPTSLNAPPSPSRLRAKSTSPVAHSVSMFSHPVHKRNSDTQLPVSVESSASVRLVSSVVKNQGTDDDGILFKASITSVVTNVEKCTEIVQKPLDGDGSEKPVPASGSDVKVLPPTPNPITSEDKKVKVETMNQIQPSKKYDGSGDDSFSSEHSYSAKPPGTMERAVNDVTITESPKDTSVLELDDQKKEETTAEPVISLSVAAPVELSVVTDEQDPVEGALKTLSDQASSLGLSPTCHSLPLAEGLNKVLPVSRGEPSNRIHMIGPVLPLSMSRDEREGTSQTLVIKIVGAHPTPKDPSSGNMRPDLKLSPSLSSTAAKETHTIDLSGMALGRKPASGDGVVAEEAKMCTKQRNGTSDSLESTVNHEQKSLRTETDSESVRSLSPITDDLGNLYRKQRSPSIDALSETSSTDGHSIHSNRADSTERLDSPASRPMRMSTRNHGRRRNSPSDSSSDTPIRDDKGDGVTLSGAAKPLVVTRGSKRRLHSNHDDDLGVQDKKKKLDPEIVDATKQLDSKPDDANVSDVKSKGNLGSASSPCGKTSARVAAAKNKANSSHELSVAQDEKQKGRKVPTKVNEVGKDESNNTKRGQKNKSLADVKDESMQQGKTDQKDDSDTKGKRTTRSSRTKDHCELPNAALLKRRRTSRDHR